MPGLGAVNLDQCPSRVCKYHPLLRGVSLFFPQARRVRHSSLAEASIPLDCNIQNLSTTAKSSSSRRMSKDTFCVSWTNIQSGCLPVGVLASSNPPFSFWMSLFPELSPHPCIPMMGRLQQLRVAPIWYDGPRQAPPRWWGYGVLFSTPRYFDSAVCMVDLEGNPLASASLPFPVSGKRVFSLL